jgi:hypothetical protein
MVWYKNTNFLHHLTIPYLTLCKPLIFKVMQKLIDRVQEQLDNNWAVDKADIQALLMFAICFWKQVHKSH